MRSVRILSPAKINLGLSVIGKRPDGYHEIDTIMAMLDLSDVITVSETDSPSVSVSGMDNVPLPNNLITKAIEGWCIKTGRAPSFHIDVEKHIPSPAGLGGGSSNAAAVIRTMDALFPDEMTGSEMHNLATSIGADCPFFLGTAAARARGIGTELTPITPPIGGAVIVVPPTEIDAKTSTMYGLLEPTDIGTYQHIEVSRATLESGGIGPFANSFTRAALEAFPGTRVAWDALHAVVGSCNLSGAGPAVYAVSSDTSIATSWARQLGEMLPADFFITTSNFIDHPPTPELLT